MAISTVAILLFLVVPVTGQLTTNRHKETSSCRSGCDVAPQSLIERMTNLELETQQSLLETQQSLLETRQSLLERIAEMEAQEPPTTYSTEIPLPDPHEQRVTFSVARTSSMGPLSGSRVVVYNKVYANDGNGYSTSSGKFTCPVSGMYYFMIAAMRRLTSDNLHVCLMKSTTQLPCIYVHNSGGRQHGASSNSVIIEVLQGDEIWVRLGDGTAVYGDSGEYTTFTGYLLYSNTQ
ncbi:caprin-2-like [Glandiceps talaboti]